MSRKLVFVLSLFALLHLLLCVRSKPVEVKAPNDDPVHNLDTGLNYTSIQAAIDASETLDGHTILVDPGTYYEHVGVHKSVSLIGKSKTTTIIDGTRTGTVIRVTVDSACISGFTIKNSSRVFLSNCVFLDNTRNTTVADNSICYGDICIYLNHSRDNKILNNTITNPDSDGICLRFSSENNISGNNISRAETGIILKDFSNNNTINGNSMIAVDGNNILLTDSSFNTLSNNTMSKACFDVGGSSLEHFIQDIDESNTVGGKPIYYWVNQQAKQVPLDAGYVAVVNSTEITVKDLTLDGRVRFAYTNNSRIENVTIGTTSFEQSYGILLSFCNNNTIGSNQLTACRENIIVISSNNNVFIYNNVTGSRLYNLFLYSSSDNIIADNILSFSQGGMGGGRGLMIYNCSSNNIVRGNTLYANYYGVSITDSSNNVIYNNLIRKNWWGILVEPWFKGSSNNTIYNNLITENKIGMELSWQNGSNSVYHNNFIDNNEQASASTRHANSWDNGVEGNYWSDYNGTDINLDGVGDSWYEINENNTDRYPLMGMFHSFNASMGYDVNAISNSTIDYFEYFESNSTIRMYVSNTTTNQTFGFCRLCIPKDLIPPPYTVIIDDGLTETLYFNDAVYDNGTCRWIYFAYPHSTHEIRITPEFPSNIIIPLFMITTLLAAAIYARKRYS